jgi:hypothetical protein
VRAGEGTYRAQASDVVDERRQTRATEEIGRPEACRNGKRMKDDGHTAKDIANDLSHIDSG